MENSKEEDLQNTLTDYSILEDDIESNKEEELDYAVNLSEESIVNMLKRMTLFNNYRIIDIKIKPLIEEGIEGEERN